MTITAPAKRRPPPRVPAAGEYTATLLSVTETAPGSYETKWRFTAPSAHDPDKSGQYTLPQKYDADEIGDLLLDLGIAPGADVELPDLSGRKAKIKTRTYGGKTSVRVVDVQPLDG